MIAGEVSQLRSFTAGDILCIVGVDGCLGFGNFGIVQCAFHPSIGWVAAKCFPVIGGKTANDLVVQQIKNELSALQQANHENILRVYGWAKWEGSVAIVTELMPVGSLRLLLGNENVPLHPVLRLRMCGEVSDGTAFIHNISSTKRLTHCDLKPENILLSKDLHCKVGDFGSARVANFTGQTTTTQITDQRSHITPVYAAPERLRQLSCRPKKEQDTYSYGLIVHGVLSRETPTQYSASEREFLDGIKRGERPDTETIDELEESLTNNEEKKIIQVLRSLMIRCWQNKPTDRPDMKDVRDQLQQLMSKQKQSDVMRSVVLALDKMPPMFVPVQSEHHLLPLDCFNPITRKFQNDTDSRRVESASHGSSSGDAGTITTTAYSSLSGNCCDEIAIQTAESVESADIPSDAKHFHGNGNLSTPHSLTSDKVGIETNHDYTSTDMATPSLTGVSFSLTLGRSRPTLSALDNEILGLLERYKICFRTHNTSGAKVVITELVSLIKTSVKTEEKQLEKFALELWNSDRHRESIAINAVVAQLYKTEADTTGALIKIIGCVRRIREASSSVIREDLSMNVMVKYHVIPLIHGIKNDMENVTSAGEETKCYKVVDVLRSIWAIEDEMDEFDAAVETYKEGLARVRETFGNEAEKRKIYGIILQEFGAFYETKSRLDDATSCFQQALDVFRVAKDVANEGVRIGLINSCTARLNYRQLNVR